VKQKKNIVVILCDQLRKDFLSCYGFKGLNTPNIDSLSKVGVLFNNAVTASPVCAPGRACMMTGRYVSDHGVFTNDVPFRDNLEYLPQRMNQLGYNTGAFGKLHHFPGKDTKGFKVAYQMEENRLKEDDDYFRWLKNIHPEVTDIFNQKKDGSYAFERTSYYEEYIAGNAMNFIKENHSKSSNMFAWISFQGPHTPIDPLDEIVNKNELNIPNPKEISFNPPCEVPLYRKVRNNTLDAKQTDKFRADYTRLIKEIDDKIGEIVNLIKSNGDFDDTMFIFSTDHGDMCGDYSMWQKGPFPYKAQLEVPLILVNADGINKGTVSNIMTGNLDIPSTVLEAAGDDRPLGYSRSIRAMLLDKDLQRNYVYSEFCDSIKMIINDEFVFSYYPFSGQQELFRRDNETENLIDDTTYFPYINECMMKIVDNMALAKGIGIEAQDLTPRVQEGIKMVFPTYKDELRLCFPLSNQNQLELLKSAGLNDSYNEFCKEREIMRSYGKYWEDK
jgi:arylsulfatase A-like enzyme